MKLAPGMHVSDKVRLVRPLGAGGMGSVWVADHLTLESTVAVKFVTRDGDPRNLARFKREASLAAKINSPHVVRIFDFGAMDEGPPYIVMELLEGEPLSVRLERETRMPLDEVVLVVQQVAVALDAAHGVGIIHRDIKPANIFLVDSHYQLFVKLLDFGIAKQSGLDVSTLTVSGAVVGTPLYMSPEQLLSTRKVDHRADLWSLAVVAYHAITGQVPFRGKTMPALTLAVTEGRFPPPSSLRPDVGPDVDAWFRIALCRNIRLRHPSAGELASSFAHAIAAAIGPGAMPAPTRVSRPSVPRVEPPPSQDVPPPLLTDDPPADATIDGAPRSVPRPRTSTSSKGRPTPVGLVAEPQPASNDRARPDRTAIWVLGAACALLALVGVRHWTRRQAVAEAAPEPTAIAPQAGPQPTAAATAASTAARAEPTAVPTIAPSASSAAPRPIAATIAQPRATPQPPPPEPTVVATAEPPPPPDCSEPFVVDANGDLKPRPECLQ
jgi:serine/threonine-protein kinase